jgi:hypothetical protein
MICKCISAMYSLRGAPSIAAFIFANVPMGFETLTINSLAK